MAERVCDPHFRVLWYEFVKILPANGLEFKFALYF
jgi:hypothetical protein